MSLCFIYWRNLAILNLPKKKTFHFNYIPVKKLLLILFLFPVISLNAQNGNAFGLKGGLNFNSNGQFSNDITSENATKNIGFHVGVFGKLDAGPIYIRPELIYTRTSSEYSIEDLIISKVDVPVLLGIDVLGPISVFLGPDFQYILSNDLGDINIDDAENEFTVGAQFGVGLNFEQFGIDLRYERGLSKNEANLTGVSNSRVDTRPEQLILSLSVKL